MCGCESCGKLHLSVCPCGILHISTYSCNRSLGKALTPTHTHAWGDFPTPAQISISLDIPHICSSFMEDPSARLPPWMEILPTDRKKHTCASGAGELAAAQPPHRVKAALKPLKESPVPYIESIHDSQTSDAQTMFHIPHNQMWRDALSCPATHSYATAAKKLRNAAYGMGIAFLSCAIQSPAIPGSHVSQPCSEMSQGPLWCWEVLCSLLRAGSDVSILPQHLRFLMTNSHPHAPIQLRVSLTLEVAATKGNALKTSHAAEQTLFAPLLHTAALTTAG